VKALVERNAARGLRAVAITTHGSNAEERAEVEKVARDHGMVAPSFLDTSGKWSSAAGITLEPAFLLIDREGRVAYRHAGKLTSDSDAFARMTSIIDKM
jgi:hypothetical protein